MTNAIKALLQMTSVFLQPVPSLFYKIKNKLQSIPFKNVLDVASNGERFTLTNAANLKTYIPSKINKKKL
jgi:hypothetical protein